MRISTIGLATGLMLLAAGAARGQDKFDVAARAKVIAPFIDEQTVAVAHVDLARIAVDPLFDQIGTLRLVGADELAGVKTIAGMFHRGLTGAGVKDVYAFFTLADGIRKPGLFAAIPLNAGADEKAIRASLLMFAVERRGDLLLVAGGRDELARVSARTPDERPELAAALEAAGDTAAQLFVLPPKHYRRVLEESVGELPKEIGGGSIKVFTRGVLWAAVAVDPPPHAALRVIAQSDDAPAAAAFGEKLAQLLRLAGADGEVRKAVPNIDQIAALLTPRAEGNRLVMALDEKNQGVDSLLKALARPIELLQGKSAMQRSMNNLKQIALATHLYLDVHKHFPLPASLSPDGKPLLSWRVQILPFIEQEALYKQFHLDESWDSPHNRTLIDKMPEIYRLSIAKNPEPGRTNYLLPVGNGAAFAADKPTEIRDISDGTSNTILIVEADDEHAAIWTKPDDWPFDPQKPSQGLGHFFNGGFCAAFCDGSVRLLPGTIDPKTLQALFTRAGGEAVSGF